MSPSQPKLAHARLELREPNPDGSVDTPGRVLGAVSLQFNPNNLNLSKSAHWVRKPSNTASSAGIPEFTGSQPAELSLEAMFDATTTLDDHVVKSVEQLLDCVRPTAESLRRNRPSPPWVILRWGPWTGLTSYVRQVDASYTVFTAAGLPIRAVCRLVLEEIGGEVKRQNPTSGTLNADRVHRTVVGDTLASLAWREYGDPTLWRVIAEANDIDDPLRLRIGDDLLIPAAHDVAPRLGGGGHGR